jgi:hypothetical protein
MQRDFLHFRLKDERAVVLVRRFALLIGGYALLTCLLSRRRIGRSLRRCGLPTRSVGR